MAEFRFRLQTLLKLRAATRDERRTALAEAYQAEQILARHEQELAEHIVGNRQRIRAASCPGEIDVDGLVSQHRHQLLLVAQRQLIQRQRQQLEAEIERRRQQLVDADRQVRALEKLRERQRDRFEYQENRKDMKQMDEVAARCGQKEERA